MGRQLCDWREEEYGRRGTTRNRDYAGKSKEKKASATITCGIPVDFADINRNALEIGLKLGQKYA